MYSKAFVSQKFVKKGRRRNVKFMQKRLYNHNIIIKADKGDAVIIAVVDDYAQEANQELGNKNLYKKLTIDTTKINRIKVNRTINVLKVSHLLDKNMDKNDLLSSEAKIPQFKMLPKVYKDGNPGRPVVSSIDSILQRFQNT